MSGGLHSLATIIKRLEAATSRLEDLTIAQGNTLQKRDNFNDLGQTSDNGSTLAPSPPPPPAPPAPSAAPAHPALMDLELPRSVTSFDERIIEDKLKSFVDLTITFAPPVVLEQVRNVENAFKCLRTVIHAASTSRKPSGQELNAFLEPLRKDVLAIMRAPEANRKERHWFNHLQVISEGIPSVGWVEVEPKPGPHVAASKESAEFYGNKIIKEFKEKEPKHVDWVRAWLALLEEQKKYVMEFHTTGLAWNPKGSPLSQISSVSSSSTAAIPPPPPPPPPATFAPVASGGAAAVFAELNRGEEVTKGLRKVDRAEMTHKNPELRSSSAAPSTSGTSPKRPAKPTKPAALAGKKPAKFFLEGSKWVIEYQENESALVVDNAQISQTVNLYGCKSSTIQIKGKVNAVTIVNCCKTSVLVDSVISSISVTNSPSFALQITGSAPTIQIDSTDSGQIYVSKGCFGVEITTAKCSSINVSLPVEGEEEGVFVERAVPEMLLTKIKEGKLVTTIVEHSG